MPYRVMLAWWALVGGVPVESVVPCVCVCVCVWVCAWGQHVCVCERGCAWRQGHAHDGTKSDSSRACAREQAKWRALAGRLGRLCRQIGAHRGPTRPIQMSVRCRVEEIYRVLGVLTCHASRLKGAKGSEAVMRLVPAPVILCMLPLFQPNLCSTHTHKCPAPCRCRLEVSVIFAPGCTLHTATAADHSPHARSINPKRGRRATRVGRVGGLTITPTHLTHQPAHRPAHLCLA